MIKIDLPNIGDYSFYIKTRYCHTRRTDIVYVKRKGTVSYHFEWHKGKINHSDSMRTWIAEQFYYKELSENINKTIKLMSFI